jgi:hypothetical protein
VSPACAKLAERANKLEPGDAFDPNPAYKRAYERWVRCEERQ